MNLAPTDAVFTAIADPTRRRILELLDRQGEAVGELAARFEVSRPAISKHLKVLSDAGLVRARRTGRNNVYELEPAPFAAVRDWLDGFWTQRLNALKRLAEGDA